MMFLFHLCDTYSSSTSGYVLRASHPFVPFLTLPSKEIICWVVSDCEHAFKALERTQHTREGIVITMSRLIPNIWRAL